MWFVFGVAMTRRSRAGRPILFDVLLVVILAAVAGCGSGNNGEEAKNNMSATKGREDSANATAALASTASAGKPVVLFFGTSLTAGLGLEPQQAFPALIEQKAAAEGLLITAVNAGLSGETTAGAARRIDWVLRTPADLVVIEGGANDALRGLSPDAARANLEQVIAIIRKKQPAAKIVLLQMEAPPNYGTPYTRSFHAIYPEIAKKENIPLAPFFLNGVAGVPRYNQADGVHPNVVGEKLVADNVWKALKPVIAQLDRVAKGG
jgi:acyl-CoA thioesterase-1